MMTPKQALDALNNWEMAIRFNMVCRELSEATRFEILMNIALLRAGVKGVTAEDGAKRVEEFVNDLKAKG